MKRVLSLVLALVLVLGMVPVFANDVTPDAAFEALMGYGFVEGGTNNDPMFDTDLTREQMAKISATIRGLGDQAVGFVGEVPYEDAALISDWATGYVAYAYEAGWMIGDGINFRPTEPVSGAEMLAILLRVLGDETAGVGERWADIEKDAAMAGIPVTSLFEISRAEAFVTMYAALVSIVDEDGLSYVQREGFAPMPEPVVTDLEVSDVVADNLKTMVITFNKAVDEETVTATTVKVMKGAVNVVSERLLSEDGMTLTIVYNTGAVVQSSELKLTVDGVKSVDATEEIEEYENTMVVTDVTIPTILGVSAINAKQIEVFFSEPINFSANFFQVINDLKIDEVSAIAKATPNYMTNSIVFELSTILEAGTYEVEVKNMVDFAGYKALTMTTNVTVIEDKNAPVMVDAVVKNLNTIEVTFDEALNAQGSFWVDGTSATATPVANSNNTKFTLTGFGGLDLSAVVQIKVEYQNQTDVVNNKVSTKTAFIFNIEDDTALPTVDLEVGTANKATLTFSKSMMTNVGTIKVINKDDVVVKTITVSALASSKWSENNTVLTLTGTDLGLNNVDAANYTLNIKDMEDATVRQNLLPEATLTFAAVDTKAPTVTATYFAKAITNDTTPGASDTITFYFSEAMDVDTLKNLSNYVKEGTTPVAFSAISGVSVKSVAADAKSVTIVYPGAGATTFAETFTVYAVKDATGNMVVTQNGIAKLGSTTLAVMGTARSSATDKVVVEFNTKMTYVDPSFIQVKKGTEAYAVPVSVSLNAAGTQATFTLSKSMDTDTTGYTVVPNNITLAENIYGSSYASDATPFSLAITDNIRPTVTVAASTTPGEIKVTFSEGVQVADLASLQADLLVRDADDTLINLSTLKYYLDGAYLGTTLPVEFDMIGVAGLTTGDDYSVELISRFVTDASAAANKVVGVSATTVTIK